MNSTGNDHESGMLQIHYARPPVTRWGYRPVTEPAFHLQLVEKLTIPTLCVGRKPLVTEQTKTESDAHAPAHLRRWMDTLPGGPSVEMGAVIRCIEERRFLEKDVALLGGHELDALLKYEQNIPAEWKTGTTYFFGTKYAKPSNIIPTWEGVYLPFLQWAEADEVHAWPALWQVGFLRLFTLNEDKQVVSPVIGAFGKDHFAATRIRI